MTDFASLLVADRGQKARLIHLVDKDSFDGWAKGRGQATRERAHAAGDETGKTSTQEHDTRDKPRMNIGAE